MPAPPQRENQRPVGCISLTSRYRILDQYRWCSGSPGPEETISAISEHEENKVVAAAAQRAEDRCERQKIKERRFQAQVRGLGPVKGPDPPSITPPDKVVEMMQVYLSERDPMEALAAVGQLLRRADLEQVDVWQRGVADANSLREKIARWRTRRYQHTTRRRG